MVGELLKKKVILFQSIHNEQIMLPELGFVNALRAYFELLKIDYKIDQRSNVEYMSPDGQLPLIKCGDELISGYEEIIDFINKKFEIQKEDQSDEIARMQLVTTVITKAELYRTWYDKDIYEQYTKSYYSYGKPWPLNNILCWLKRRDVLSKIDNIKNMDNELEGMLEAIQSINISYNPKVSCLIYGHLKAILLFGKPYDALSAIIKKYSALLEFINIFEDKLRKEH